MSECHKKAWNRQAQRRRGGERGGWRDLRRQTTDKKILSGKKGVFYSPLFVAAGGIFDPEDPVLEMSLSQWKKGQPIKKR